VAQAGGGGRQRQRHQWWDSGFVLDYGVSLGCMDSRALRGARALGEMESERRGEERWRSLTSPVGRGRLEAGGLPGSAEGLVLRSRGQGSVSTAVGGGSNWPGRGRFSAGRETGGAGEVLGVAGLGAWRPDRRGKERWRRSIGG
jgi:hypothetical protein